MSNGTNNPGGGNPPQSPTPSAPTSPAAENELQVLKDIKDVMKEVLSLSNEISNQAQRNVNSYQAELISLQERKKILDQQTSSAEKQYELLLLQKQEREIEIKLLKSSLDLINEDIIKEKEKLKSLPTNTEQYNEQLRTIKELEEWMTTGLFSLKESERELRKFNEANKIKFETTEAASRAEQRFGELAENSYQMLLKQIGASTGLGDIVTAFAAGPFAGMVAVMERVVAESVKLFDVVLKGDQQFAATTGQIAQRSLTFGYGMSQFGVGFQQMNEATMGLYTSMSGFTDQTQEVQEQLAGAAAKMKNLGVDIATTGKNFDILTKSLKMSAETAIDTQDKIAKAAIGAGIAPSVMLKEFANNMPRLAAYGQQAVDIFIKLEKQAKSLGMTVQELNGIVGEQYDTFDGAATGAGKLNAILGGNYLNSIQMMNANESERIMIIKRAVDASGLQIDGMHKFQQIAIANAMGIKDLSKLKNLLGKSTTELTMDMEKEAATQKELEKVQKAAADVQQKMNTAFQGLLVIISPLVNVFKKLIDLISAFADLGGGIGGVVLGLATAFTILYRAMSMPLGRIGWMAGLLVAIQLLHYWLLEPHSPILYFALLALPLMIYAIGTAADANEKALLSLGASIMMVGTGVYLASSGLSMLVQSFKDLNEAQLGAVSDALGYFTLMFVGFTLALTALALSGVGEIAVGLLLAFGGAVLMIGLGVGIAAAGISILVESIAKLASGLTSDAAANLVVIASAITLLVGALSVTGTIGLIGLTVGSLALASSLTRIISSVNNIQADKMSNFSSMLKTLAETLKLNGIETISVQIANAINNISTAIDKVPENKSVNFTSTMDSINRTFSSIAQVDATKLESAKQFVDTATKYYTVQKDSKGADNDALVAALAKAIGGLSSSKGGAAGPENIVIKLEVDGQKMAEVVQKINEKKPLTGKVTY